MEWIFDHGFWNEDEKKNARVRSVVQFLDFNGRVSKRFNLISVAFDFTTGEIKVYTYEDSTVLGEFR